MPSAIGPSLVQHIDGVVSLLKAMAGKKRSPTVAERAPGSAEEKLEEFSPEQLTDFLRQMLAIRRFEERAAQAYGQGAVGGFCHLYIGQEAVAVGALAALVLDNTIPGTDEERGLVAFRAGMK